MQNIHFDKIGTHITIKLLTVMWHDSGLILCVFLKGDLLKMYDSSKSVCAKQIYELHDCIAYTLCEPNS